MTVIVLTKHQDKYFLHADGRTSQDWMGIASDSATKIHKGKDCIFGISGHAAARVIMKELFSHTCKPMDVIRKLSTDKFKPYLKDAGLLVATSKYGCYTLYTSSYGDVNLVTWQDDDLPQFVGSGFINVRTLLSVTRNINPRSVKKAIQDAYKVNHTIGGRILELSLEKE